MIQSLPQWPVRTLVLAVAAVVVVGGFLVPRARGADPSGAHGAVFTVDNESGMARTISVSGSPVIAEDNPFFLNLGTNGRACVTCHEPRDNMSITPARVRARFEATAGTDPIFRTNDGSNSPLADVSTVEARRAAYSMLLGKGLIRVGIAIPADAEFELAAVNDPYGYAGANANGNELSLFRRPLPSTNLSFLSTVMWDGRETSQRGSAAAMHFDLSGQANGATQGHAQALQAIDAATREAIVAYELSLYTAQIFDRAAGQLHADGADGGPEALSLQAFVFGSNDPLGCDANGANCNPGNATFEPIVFTEFAAWSGLPGGGRNRSRAAVARGEKLFNTLPVRITNVAGINDDFDVPVVVGTCTTCHDTAHAGSHSVPAPLDIGVADPPLAGTGLNASGLAVGDMPVYTLRHKTTGAIKVVTDPGRALISGKWADVARFKGPILRGLSGRQPYFHNGAAGTLSDVVDFYDHRFDLGLSAQDKEDLVAFLRAL